MKSLIAKETLCGDYWFCCARVGWQWRPDAAATPYARIVQGHSKRGRPVCARRGAFPRRQAGCGRRKGEFRQGRCGCTGRLAAQTGKIIYTGVFTLMVRDVIESQDKAKAVAEGQGGYVQRLAGKQVVLRVPSDKFYPTVREVSNLAAWVVNRQITTEEVSDKYTDLEIRIRNARVLRDRLAGLLEKNVNHKEVIELEQELARATTQLEELEAQFRRLNDQVAMATLTLDFETAPQNLPAELRIQLPFNWLHTMGLNTLLNFNGRNLY